MSETRGLIPGFEAPIYQGVWRRVLTMGVPRTYYYAWTLPCLAAGLGALYLTSLLLLVGVGLTWVIGHAVLVALTQLDPHWDAIAMAGLGNRYREAYDAG